MKKLTITVLVAGLFAGSLFASENNTMMGMNKDNSSKKELSVHEKHQEFLNSDNTGYGG
jgi:hypothetical protein